MTLLCKTNLVVHIALIFNAYVYMYMYIRAHQAKVNEYLFGY